MVGNPSGFKLPPKVLNELRALSHNPVTLPVASRLTASQASSTLERNCDNSGGTSTAAIRDHEINRRISAKAVVAAPRWRPTWARISLVPGRSSFWG